MCRHPAGFCSDVALFTMSSCKCEYSSELRACSIGIWNGVTIRTLNLSVLLPWRAFTFYICYSVIRMEQFQLWLRLFCAINDK